MEVIVFVIHSVIFFYDLENSLKGKKGGWGSIFSELKTEKSHLITDN